MSNWLLTWIPSQAQPTVWASQIHFAFPLWQRSPYILAPGTGFLEDNFSTDRVGYGSGSKTGNGEWWGVADEALLAHPPLTSCCVARFLTGRGRVPVLDPGIGNPWSMASPWFHPELPWTHGAETSVPLLISPWNTSSSPLCCSAFLSSLFYDELLILQH